MRSDAAWTPAQRRAIAERGRDILVSAAAGSGKTSVLVQRVIERLLDPADPLTLDRVLVVTFTESAAAEMKERIRAALLDAGRGSGPGAARHAALLESAAISTLHSFCHQLLRRNFHVVGLDPAFRVLDEEEAAVLKQASLDEAFEEAHALQGEASSGLERLLDHYGGARDDRDLRGVVLALYEFVQSLPDGEGWLERAVAAFDAALPEGREALRRWQEVLLHHARRDVGQTLSFLESARRLALLPSGPGEYEPVLARAAGEVQRLAEALDRGEWDEVCTCFETFAWPRLPSAKECDPSLKEEVKRLWDQAKERVNFWSEGPFGRRIEEYAAEVAALQPVAAALAALVRAFAARYEAAKRRAAAVDFADLERLALKALQRPEVAGVYRERFEEVVVDEYQDINPVQDRLLELLSRSGHGSGNRFLVGDVKQSIYGFRLADPRIFWAKSEAFGASAPGGPCRIDLQENFRSHPQILEAVNFIFRQIMHKGTQEIEYGPEAWLKPGRSGEDDARLAERVELHLIEREDPEGEETGLSGADREALLVGRLIKELVASGWSYGDIAVLFRSPKGRVDHFVERLAQMGIPSYSRAASGFFRAVEVETVLSLLRLIDNARQEIPLAAVLRSPLVGLTSSELAAIRAGGKELSFVDAARRRAQGGDGLAARLSSFFRALDEWRKAARRMPLSRLLWRLYQETGYLDFARAMPGGKQREANLLGLYRRARSFDAFATHGLQRFLRHVDELEEAGEEAAPPPALGEGEQVVQLLSVHQSKGLEFPVVIVCDLDRRWNRTDARRPIVFHRDLGIAPAVLDRERHVRYPSLAHWATVRKLDHETLAEEMRLLYVATTRAKERLILVGSASDLQRRCAAWAEAARTRGWALPAGSVLSAASWLDWIGAAVSRHRSGEPLRALGAGDLGPEFYTPADDEVAGWSVSFSVRVWRGCDLAEPAAPADAAPHGGPGAPGEGLGAATRGPALEEAEVIRAVERLYGWRYPHQALTEVPAKLSVTEASKLMSPPSEDDASPLWEEGMKRLLRQARGTADGVSPAERGSATHLLLARMDLLRAPARESLEEALEELVARGLVRAEAAGAVDLDAVARFLESPAGVRLRRAARGENGAWVRRELVFTMAVPPGWVYPGIEVASLPGGAMVVQGSVDALVKDEEGLLLIDFKTDRVRSGEEERASGAYVKQVALYARFVRTLEPGARLEALLYFLETGRALPVRV